MIFASSAPLRVLIVEDNPDDAELLEIHLRRGGHAIETARVETAEALRARLAERPWQVVISDYSLPHFNAAEALEIVRGASPDLPFIVVSGVLGEDAAVAAMRNGVSDYLTKGNLARLLPAVERELREADGRRALRQAERDAHLLAAVVRASADAIVSLSPDGVVLTWNAAAERLYGWPAEEAIGRRITFIAPAERRHECEALLDAVRAGRAVEGVETVRLRRDGGLVETSVSVAPVFDDAGRVAAISKVSRDLTTKRVAERALQESELRFRALVDRAFDAVMLFSAAGIVSYAGASCAGILGRTPDELVGRDAFELLHPDDRPRVDELWARLLASPGATLSSQHRVLAADGRARWVEARLTNLLAEPRVGAAVVNFRDVTEKVAADAALARDALLLANVRDSVVVTDLEGRVTYWNEGATRLYGWTAEETLGRPLVERFPEGERDAPRALLNAVLGGREISCECEDLRKDGARVWVDERVGLLRDDRGRAVGVLFVAHDVTDRKQVQEEFEAFMRHCPAAAFVKDDQGRLVSVNPAWLRQFDPPPTDWKGKTDFDLWPRETAELFRASDRDCLARDAVVQIEETSRLPNGEERTWMVMKFPLHGPRPHVGGMAWDVTDRVRAERELRHARAEAERRLSQLRTIVASMTDGVVIADVEGNFLDWNEAALRMHGFKSLDEARRPLEQFLAEYDLSLPDGTPLPPHEWPVVRVLRGERLFEHELRVKRKGDATEKIFSYGGAPVFGPDGTVKLGVMTLHDVTDRRRAEEALRQRDRAIQTLRQGILITDPTQPDNPIIFANAGFLALTGYSLDDIRGRNCRFLQGKDTDPAAVAKVRAAVAEGGSCVVELLNYKKNGEPFWNELSIAAVRDDEGRLTHFVGVQNDVTERRRLEEQYRQSQKMEAVGRLAGGVAHDFNNLLTVIGGYSEHLLDTLPAEDANRPLVEAIHEAGERSANLTRQLLLFSRKEVVAPTVLDLNEVVTDAEKLLRRVIGEDVRLETKLRPLSGRIKADRGQLEQVLLNLAINARDAMPQGGRLTIETAQVELESDFVSPEHPTRPGPHATLTVTDSGCGMTPEVRARVFEPFFTTKEAGKGTGLGLSVVHGIVRQAGGRIEVESEPGAGARFTLHFPCVDDGRRLKSPTPAPVPARGAETILLVEDEAAVRALTKRVLTNCGYDVLEAPDGEAALALADADARPIHLLLTDVVMPGLGGRRLAERLAAVHPEAKVLYVSGYTDDAIVRHGVREEQVHFLQKPFSPATLAAKVREVLDGA